MLGYDLKIACAKFQRNWFIIDGEIDKKHALHIYQNNYVPGDNSEMSFRSLGIIFIHQLSINKDRAASLFYI